MIACHIFKTSVTIHEDSHFCEQTKCSKAVILPIYIKKITEYNDAPLQPILIHSNKHDKLGEFNLTVFDPTSSHGLLSDHVAIVFVSWQ